LHFFYEEAQEKSKCFKILNNHLTTVLQKDDINTVLKSLSKDEHVQFHSLLHTCIPFWRLIVPDGRVYIYNQFASNLFDIVFEQSKFEQQTGVRDEDTPMLFKDNPMLKYYNFVPGLRVAWNADSEKPRKKIPNTARTIRHYEQFDYDNTTHVLRKLPPESETLVDIRKAEIMLSMLGNECWDRAIFLNDKVFGYMSNEMKAIENYGFRIMKRLPESVIYHTSFYTQKKYENQFTGMYPLEKQSTEVSGSSCALYRALIALHPDFEKLLNAVEDETFAEATDLIPKLESLRETLLIMYKDNDVLRKGLESVLKLTPFNVTKTTVGKLNNVIDNRSDDPKKGAQRQNMGIRAQDWQLKNSE